MGNDLVTLKIVQKEPIPDCTFINQTDDGTILYYKYLPPHRLYVKWRGREFDADLPAAGMAYIDTMGNSTFMKWKSKIYKASFIAPNQLIVSYFRDELKEESIARGYCMQKKGDKTFCYRLNDDPKKDRLAVEVPVEHRARFSSHYSMKRIHRGKVIYFSIPSKHEEPRVRMLTDNVIVVEVLDTPATTYTSSDSSPFVYFASDEQIHAVNIDSLELLPPLQISGVGKILCIAGVRNGVITVRGRIDASFYLITAQLPEKYFETASAENAEVVVPRRFSSDVVSLNSLDDSLEALSEQCCCAICSETFDATRHIPRVLDCGHTFCEMCIYNEKLVIHNSIICPNCSKVIDLSGAKQLPVNYFAIGMAEQTLKSRIDPKVACTACNINYSSSSIRICVQKDCVMYNQLICLSCVVDGGHMGHKVIKYDARMEKIREKLRAEVTNLSDEMEERKSDVLILSKKISQLLKALETNLSTAKIPPQVIQQLEGLNSEQDANEYREIVREFASSLTTECDALSEAMIDFLNSAAVIGLLESRTDAEEDENELITTN